MLRRTSARKADTVRPIIGATGGASGGRVHRSKAPTAPARLSWLFAVVASFMALLFSSAPAAVIAAVASSTTVSQVVEEERAEEVKSTVETARWNWRARARVRQPAQPERPRVVLGRAATKPPLAATAFIPPQRKTLLRWLI